MWLGIHGLFPSKKIDGKCLFNSRFFCFHFHLCLLSNSKVLFGRAQVLETWLTCVCWHVTWNSWIVSIEIGCKCLFNTRLFCFHFHLCLLSNSKVLFARAQVCDPLIYCVWHVTFGWLSTITPAWLQGVSSNIWIDLASSHYPLYDVDVQLFFCRRSGMRPTDWFCLACEFRVAINEQSGMTTGRKFQYLQLKMPPLTSHFVCLMCNSCLSVLRYARYATHWLIVFGMWISGGYQWTFRHDYSV